MSKIPCTKNFVDDLPFDGDKQTLYWFEGLTGFGVLCSGKKKIKTLIVQRAVKGKGVVRRISIVTREQMEAKKPPMTMAEAKSAASKLLMDMQNGIDPLEEKRDAAKAKAALEAKNKIESVTLGQAFALYLESHVNLRKRSQDSYTHNLKLRFKDWMDTPLNSITPDDLVERYLAIQKEVEEGNFRKKYGDVCANKPGVAAANGALRVIRAVWSFAAIRKPGVPPWPKGWFTPGTTYKMESRKRHLEPKDLKGFYSAVNKTNEAGEYVIGRIARDAIMLLLFTGMRFRECTELSWDRIDFKNKIIHFDAKDRKENKAMDLPMSDFVFGILKSREDEGKSGPFVFPGWGKSGHLEQLQPAFRTIQKLCGIRQNPHSLRHTFISVAEESEISGFKARALVGHSGKDVHDKVYNHGALADAAQKVADKMMEFCIPPLTVVKDQKAS